MMRRGVYLPSRRFVGWTAVVTIIPMTLSIIAWAETSGIRPRELAVLLPVGVGALSIAIALGASELLQRLEAVGGNFEAPLLRNWASYYGIWGLLGLAIGCARGGLSAYSLGVPRLTWHFFFEVVICLYAALIVAFSLEHQTMFMRVSTRKHAESRRAIGALFESREAFVLAMDRRRRALQDLLEQRVEPELRAVQAGISSLQAHAAERSEHARYEDLLARLEHVRDSEIRHMSHLLHPSIIAVGLRPALKALMRSRRQAFEAKLETDEAQQERIDFPQRLKAYRVVEQALEMASQHAARLVRVSLLPDGEGRLALSIEALGDSLELDSLRRDQGMALLEARLALLGGEWSLRELSEPGVVLRVSFPPVSGSNQAEVA